MLTLIDTFLSVYETKSFTKTAEQLFISQPSVSVHIKKMEQHFDVILFRRGGNHQLIPTKHADYLYTKLQLIKQDWQRLQVDTKHLPTVKKDINIALSNTNALKIFPTLLPNLINKFPQVNFHLIETNSQQAQKMLKQYQADLCLIEDDLLDIQIDRQPFTSDELVHCGDSNSSYWLLREPSSGTYHFQNEYLKQHNLQPDFVHVNSNEMMVELLKNGVGQTILSRRSIPDASHIPINSVVTERMLYLITRKTETDSLVLAIKHYLLTLANK